MELQALGYVGIRASDLDEWATYATRFLGLQLVDKTRGELAFRMDDRKQRIVIAGDGGEGMGVLGFEVADAGALGALAARMEQAGVSVARGSRSLAEQRRVRDLIVFHDPVGNRLEVFHGAETASDPFKPGRAISGFRTGPLGMGHVVLNVERLDEVMPFYQGLLGFQLSDYALRPFRAFFFHINPRHHSLAFLETGKNSAHHLMMELFMLDDVGQAYDLALGMEGNIGTTLGRHTNDFMTSFYSWTPSGFMVEYGWGGRDIDPVNWEPEEMTYGPSLWGHDRYWLDEAARAEARRLRIKAAADGLRQPVRVLEGNYHLAPGICPWWDAQASK